MSTLQREVGLSSRSLAELLCISVPCLCVSASGLTCIAAGWGTGPESALPSGFSSFWSPSSSRYTHPHTHTHVSLANPLNPRGSGYTTVNAMVLYYSTILIRAQREKLWTWSYICIYLYIVQSPEPSWLGFKSPHNNLIMTDIHDCVIRSCSFCTKHVKIYIPCIFLSPPPTLHQHYPPMTCFWDSCRSHPNWLYWQCLLPRFTSTQCYQPGLVWSPIKASAEGLCIILNYPCPPVHSDSQEGNTCH